MNYLKYDKMKKIIKKSKAFFSQLWCAISNTKYPSAYTWNYWSSNWKGGTCNYEQWQTLLNYLTNQKKS